MSSSGGRFIAILTGTLSIGIGIVYLILIAVLDSRGPMVPPPPEALGVVEVVSFFPALEALQLSLKQFVGIFLVMNHVY